MYLDHNSGLIDQAIFIESPNCDEREQTSEPEVIIIHCISLPPGEYHSGVKNGSDAISRFFCNSLSSEEHPYYAGIADIKVSSHFLIQRDGVLIQYVPTNKRAWHAGESVCLGRPKVNDFSIGIELEGLDSDPNGFTDSQYDALNKLMGALKKAYPAICSTNVFAHSDIAPGRKFDPGPYFEWSRVFV